MNYQQYSSAPRIQKPGSTREDSGETQEKLSMSLLTSTKNLLLQPRVAVFSYIAYPRWPTSPQPKAAAEG